MSAVRLHATANHEMAEARSDRFDPAVFVHSAALGAAEHALQGIDFVLEGADRALCPFAELPGFDAAACDLVADPSEEDSSQEDKEGCKNQPRQWHANHGTIGGGALEPK